MPKDINVLRHVQFIIGQSNATMDATYFADTKTTETDFGLPEDESLSDAGFNNKKIIVSSAKYGREHRFQIETITGTSKPTLHSMGMLLKDYRQDTTDASDLGEPPVPYFLEISDGGIYLEVSTGFKLRIS